MKKSIAVLLLVVLATSGAIADNVYLKNGQVYTRCRARNLGNGRIEIIMPGGKVELPDTEVAYIEKERVPDEEFVNVPPPPSPVLEALKAAKGSVGAKTEAKDKTEERVKQLLPLLKDDDAGVRAEATEALLSIGQKAVPFLLPHIDSTDAALRLGVSNIIAELKPRNATRQLLEALYAASPAQGPAPYYQQQYLMNLNAALVAATGQNFFYMPTLDTQEALAKWVDWYKANAMLLPAQIGDPEKPEKADDPAYLAKLAKARELKTIRKSLAPAGVEVVVPTEEQ